MKLRAHLAVLLAILLGAVNAHAATPAALPPGFQRIDAQAPFEILSWTDTCNVYILRDGASAILIDLGDGSVLDHLSEIGVRQVEWVLFTHHHREQCQGAAKLKGSNAKLAAPDAERALFENPLKFRTAKASLGDPMTIHGSSYVRPPIAPIPLDRTFQKVDTFTWHGRTLHCVDTRGNSPGGMSYMLKSAGRWLAFSGDLMLDGAKMHTWFDTEWDYGFAAGLYALVNSVSFVETYDPLLLLPSHGPIIRNPVPQLQDYGRKLRALAKIYVRGYAINTLAGADQDTASRPTDIPQVWRITPHLYKFKAPDFWPNFAILIADSGRALVFDCGLLDKGMLDRSLKAMQAQLGLKQIDACLITHMHGDHILEAPWLREHWGAKIWTLDVIAEQFESPHRFAYAAPVQAYGAGLDSVKLDRTFKSGESFKWEGYTFTVDWMPGQTEFGCCIQGRIDGRLVAFTGDNLFASPTDPAQDGHEAVVAHNSAIFEEGYIYAAEYLQKLQPDLIVAGHSFVMDKPRALIERYHDWSLRIRDAYQGLSATSDYRYMFDPFWVRADPYRLSAPAGTQTELTLHLRNFTPRPRTYRIALHAPEGITADPQTVETQVSPQSTAHIPVKLRLTPALKPGIHLIALDTTLDNHRHGELFDFILNVTTPATGR